MSHKTSFLLPSHSCTLREYTVHQGIRNNHLWNVQIHPVKQTEKRTIEQFRLTVIIEHLLCTWCGSRRVAHALGIPEMAYPPTQMTIVQGVR